jgi:hypothetical protein
MTKKGAFDMNRTNLSEDQRRLFQEYCALHPIAFNNTRPSEVPMQNELLDLVQRAQNGDEEALYLIISSFLPTIRKARRKLKSDLQEDMEQDIIETIIKKVLSYDVTKTPNFSAFCRNLEDPLK